ncbi:MAG: xanthine dehydrogenase family protein molybdopterin-binding subunit [Acidimicrobiia bacterium]|nr:xanthine dehydrogenase family protein molybdopterin-binding subunit [Acidimicrobiia bacterium]
MARREDGRLIVGRGRFVSDLQLARMRHVAFVRSPVAHARITALDIATASAEATAVFTADSPGFDVALRAQSALPGYVETDQPVLARGKVRFVGEAVALVVADDRYRAEDAAELVAFDYEPLRPTVQAWGPTGDPVHDEAPDNVLLSRTFEAGDVDAALAGAATVVRRELVTNRHGGNPMEGRAVVALWEDATHLTLWAGTQVPHLVRNLLAELLDLHEANVRVVAPDVGGGFGTKAVLYPEDVAVVLAARSMPGTALKWVEDRVEHLLAATHARDHRYVVEAGFDADGRLLGVRADVTCNVGAYSVYPWTAGIEPLMAGGLLTGPYKVEHYRCHVAGVATNTSPSGPYRGVARPATVFAMEALIDSGARGLGLDPLDVRRTNLIGPDDVPYRLPTRLVDDTGHYAECLDLVAERLDATARRLGVTSWRVEQARRRAAGEAPIGLGFACYNELTGLGRAASAGPRMPFRTGHEAATVRVNPDGRVLVLSGVTSQGQGWETTLAKIVADALGVEPDDVDVRFGDTDQSLWGFGAFSSRQAVIAGGAAQRSALAVRDQLVRLAAELYEANPADLDIAAGHITVAGSPEPLGTVAELARIAYLESNRLPDGVEPGLDATRFYDPVMGAFAAGAQGAVIEVDPATGQLRALAWVCVEDAGRVIDEQIVHGQIAGSIAQGIGGALYEHVVYDDAGNPLTTTLLDYLMPTSAEIPELDIAHVSHPADNPLGVRGVGEGGTLGPNAVLAGALADALGVEVDELPLRPDRVWAAARDSAALEGTR